MVKTKCPQPCACAMTHVVSNRAGDIIPLITVDCSYHNLTTPPASLPPSTTTLKLIGNKVEISIFMNLLKIETASLSKYFTSNRSVIIIII